MKRVTINAYAKVNLTLEIVGEDGGYHLLDSLVASVDLHDVVRLTARRDKLSSVIMKGLGSESIAPETNNALKGAEAFSQTFGVNGVDITVYKNIPMGAGLGGSSADVSAVLLGMAKLYGIQDQAKIETLAEKLGSDTKYMLKGGFARMQGRGTQLKYLDVNEKLYFLAICPFDSVSSGACYQKYDALPKPERAESYTENCIRLLREKDVNGAGRYLVNDLYPPACALSESVRKAYEEALSFSPSGVVMTGSGSCVLALFETRELCEWAKSRYRGKYRTLVMQTVTPSKQKTLKSVYQIEEE